MDRRLLLEPAERETLALEAVAALERLRERRAASRAYTPADPDLIRTLLAPPAADGGSTTDLLERFIDAAAAGWDKTNGGSYAFIPNGALQSGVIGALLAAGAHGFTGAAFEAPALVALEEGVLRWMTGLFGMPDGSGGLLLSGGSLANQTAVVTARARADAQGRGRAGATMYVSGRAHHSVAKAARLAGLEPDGIRIVATDRHGRLDAGDLRRAIADDATRGRWPFLIVGVAGSTDTGSIDPLAALADVAAATGAWLHVDAAYGGFFALTERGRSRLAGIERADSITVDAHKGLFLPYGVGAILVRDPVALVEAHEGTGAYMRDVPRIDGLPHYFERGPELTRPFRGAAVWFPLHLHGTTAFARELDRMLDLAESAHERLATTPGIEVGPPPTTSIVTFRATAGDAATERVVAALHDSGRFQVSTTSLDERVTLRFAFLSPQVTEARVAEAIDIVAATVASTGSTTVGG